MKNTRLPLLFVAAAIVAGCAAPPTLKDRHRAEIEKGTQRVEIFYSPEEHAVVHRLGQTGRNVAAAGGLFGFAGLAFGLMAMVAVDRQSVDDSKERSKEFRRLSADVAAARRGDMNRAFAEQLASHLRASGREVRLTQVQRLDGHLPGSAAAAADVTPPAWACTGGHCGSPAGTPGMAEPPAAPAPSAGLEPLQAGVGYTPTPGYAPLLLRITTAYGAASIMDSYRPLVVVESVLVDAERGEILAHSQTEEATAGRDTRQYLRWDDLKDDVPAARQQLEDRLLGLAARVRTALFDFSATR